VRVRVEDPTPGRYDFRVELRDEVAKRTATGTLRVEVR
jgi:hypothetical protein